METIDVIKRCYIGDDYVDNCVDKAIEHFNNKDYMLVIHELEWGGKKAPSEYNHVFAFAIAEIYLRMAASRCTESYDPRGGGLIHVTDMTAAAHRFREAYWLRGVSDV